MRAVASHAEGRFFVRSPSFCFFGLFFSRILAVVVKKESLIWFLVSARV